MAEKILQVPKILANLKSVPLRGSTYKNLPTAKVTALRQKGWSITQIADRFKVSRSVVFRRMQIAKTSNPNRPVRQVGRKTVVKSVPITPHAIAKGISNTEGSLVKDYLAGIPMKEIAAKYGTSTSSVYRKVRKAKFFIEAR